MRDCLAASGCEATTVAVRRERLVDKEGRNILDYLDLRRYTILPNTAGCFSAEDAIRHARLARELLTNLDNPGAQWVKLECLGDPRTLLPDPVATLQATEQLVKAVSHMPRLDDIDEYCIEINRLENEVDNLHRRALADLFEKEKDPITIIKNKEILEDLETATDKCEDVANVIEGIVLKNA